MPSARAVLATASAAVSVLVAAAPAGAATVATLPCVRTAPGLEAPQPIIGTGFTPGARVTLQTTTSTAPTPSFRTSVMVDGAGNFATTTSPPFFNPFNRKLQTFNLIATDGANPANIALTTFQRVAVGYSTSPSSGRPTTKAKHTARGFVTGRNVYLHFRFRGKTRRNVKLGKAKGVCGVVSRRMSLLPTRSRRGRWTVYTDQRRSFSKTTKPQLKGTFTISRRFL